MATILCKILGGLILHRHDEWSCHWRNGLPYIRYVGVTWFVLHVSLRLLLHNKTCVVLANLWWHICKKTVLKIKSSKIYLWLLKVHVCWFLYKSPPNFVPSLLKHVYIWCWSLNLTQLHTTKCRDAIKIYDPSSLSLNFKQVTQLNRLT